MATKWPCSKKWGYEQRVLVYSGPRRRRRPVYVVVGRKCILGNNFLVDNMCFWKAGNRIIPGNWNPGQGFHKTFLPCGKGAFAVSNLAGSTYSDSCIWNLLIFTTFSLIMQPIKLSPPLLVFQIFCTTLVSVE